MVFETKAAKGVRQRSTWDTNRAHHLGCDICCMQGNEWFLRLSFGSSVANEPTCNHGHQHHRLALPCSCTFEGNGPPTLGHDGRHHCSCSALLGTALWLLGKLGTALRLWIFWVGWCGFWWATFGILDLLFLR